MFEKRYVVHSAVSEPAQVEVEFAGRKTTATVEGIVVELKAADGGHTFTLRDTPEDVPAALEMFKPKAVIVATFKPEDAKK